MNKLLPGLLLILMAPAFLVSCRKKAFDDFYGRPDSLEPPIYQQLEDAGRFTHLLALIDKSGYEQTLSAAGYWTFFAPNDSAFESFFAEKNLSGIEAIDSATARAMVQFLLVYNSFEKDRLDDYQSTANNAGWVPSVAFRRRTAYYTGFYKDSAVNNRPVMAVANNRNSSGDLDGDYVAEDYNNKYITYFTDDYFATNNLSASDYEYFYPNSEYTGFNVLQAKVVTSDMVAENGVIHEIDKVITPLQSIEEYIRNKPEYSSFRKILNRLDINKMVQFIYNSDASRRYQILSGKSDSVFVKVYSSLLAFAPNNENFTKEEVNDGQRDCWTIFIPKNEAVDAYVNNVLLEYYPSLDEMPEEIIADFLNSHLFPTVVWPSKFSVTRNSFSEPARFDPYADVFDRELLSNGLLYGTNSVQEPDVFRTVFSKAYLNPKFSMMTRLLKVTGLNLLVAKSNVPVNMLMVPDAVFDAAGFHYNVSKDQFEYTSSAGTTTNGVYDKLTRIVATCVFFDPYRASIDDLSGSGIVKSGDAGTEGDFIKYDNNTIVTAGLEDAGLVANIDSVKTAVNGKVYFIDQLPVYSEENVGHHIKQLGEDPSSSYNYFWQYLMNSPIYNSSTEAILGLTGFSTVFIPDNDAIVAAVNDGVLPGSGGVPNFSPSSENDKALVQRFIQYHLLNGHTIVPDGVVTGTFNTFLQDDQGDALTITVINNPGDLSVKDDYGRVAHVYIPSSNNLSNRSVIHLIDNYLRYNEG